MNAPENYAAYSGTRDDEIDLREMALAIYTRWKWIAASVIFCTLFGVLYISIATPTYSTRISYSATPGGLDVLNSMPGTNYSESDAFEEFSRRLSSYENFRSFYETKPDIIRPAIQDDLGTPSKIRSFFFDQISISAPKEEETSRTLSLRYNEKTDGPQVLNEYFRWTEETYSQTLADRASRSVNNAINRNKAEMDAHLRSHQDDVAARIERLQEQDKIKIAELEDQLRAEKQSVISSRKERVRILQHAEQIASNLGIEKPTTPRDLGRQTQDRDVIYAEINSQGELPLYFMGVDALRAERKVIEQNLEEDANTEEIREIESELEQLRNNRTIEAITNRENQAPFIDEYNKLRSQNEILSASRISPSDIDVVSPIHWAYQPDKPESPKTLLIIALSLVLGGMLGVILVLFANFISSIKPELESDVQSSSTDLKG